MKTLEDVQKATQKCVEQFPNRRNPKLAGAYVGGCVYTGPTGKTHCIAGQVLIELGYGDKVPGYGEQYNQTDIEQLLMQKDIIGDFDPQAIKFLEEAQGAFDNRQKWSTAYRQTLKNWEDALKYDELDEEHWDGF